MKIYVVTTSEYYSDCGQSLKTPIKAFSSKEKAEEYAKKLDSEHFPVKPDYWTDQFENLYHYIDDEWYDYIIDDEYLCNPPRNNNALIAEYRKVLNEKEIKFKINYFKKNGLTISEEQIQECKRYDDSLYDSWENTEVVELELD